VSERISTTPTAWSSVGQGTRAMQRALVFVLITGACYMPGSLAAEARAPAQTKPTYSDELVAALDRLFSRTDLHRMKPDRANPNVLRVSTASNTGTVTGVQWCGPRLLRFHYGHFDYDPDEKIPPDHGWYLSDIQSRISWRLKALPLGGNLVSCSPDGQWLLYSSASKDSIVISRYNLYTGKREPFARFNGGTFGPERSWLEGKWSPDGNRIIYFGRSIEALKIDDPVWKIFWFKREKREQVPTDFGWLADSSSLAIRFRHDPLDFSSPFEIAIVRSGDPSERLQVLTGAPASLGRLQIDSVNNIYGVEGVLRETRLRRCRLNDTTLKCEVAIPGDPDVSTAYDISIDGKTVYYKAEDSINGSRKNCLWRYRRDSNEKSCVALQQWTKGLSPDGLHIAVSGAPGDSFSVYLVQDPKK